MIASCGGQKTTFKKQPLEDWNGVCLTEEPQFRSNRNSLLRGFKGNDSSWVILQVLTNCRVVVDYWNAQRP
jgi:hypothetical protein